MAQTYGVPSVAQKFEVSDPVAISLNDAIQDSDAFLRQISILPVVDMKGQPMRISVPDSVASRTDTSDGTTERSPQTAGSPTAQNYEVVQTNFDIAMGYNLLDTWARFPDFRQRYMQAIYRRIALDRIMIGWHGESAAATSDRATYPLLQDVNLGWFRKLTDGAPAQYLTEGVADSGRINLCANGDFENLDAMVYSVYSMIDRAHRTGNEVVIVGEELITQDTGKVLASHAQTPTEKNALRTLDKSYAGLQSVIVPHFPDRGIMVTDLSNLHLYYQASAVRRHTKEEPEKDRIADYISSNEAYCFGDYEGVAALKGANVYFDLPAEG
jgi:P2 family phage major capsid protein